MGIPEVGLSAPRSPQVCPPVAAVEGRWVTSPTSGGAGTRGWHLRSTPPVSLPVSPRHTHPGHPPGRGPRPLHSPPCSQHRLVSRSSEGPPNPPGLMTLALGWLACPAGLTLARLSGPAPTLTPLVIFECGDPGVLARLLSTPPSPTVARPEGRLHAVGARDGAVCPGGAAVLKAVGDLLAGVVRPTGERSPTDATPLFGCAHLLQRPREPQQSPHPLGEPANRPLWPKVNTASSGDCLSGPGTQGAVDHMETVPKLFFWVNLELCSHDKNAPCKLHSLLSTSVWRCSGTRASPACRGSATLLKPHVP